MTEDLDVLRQRWEQVKFYESSAQELISDLLARLDAQQQDHHAEMNGLLAGFTEERAARQREFDEQFDRRQAVQQRLDAVTALVTKWRNETEKAVGTIMDPDGWMTYEVCANELAAVLTGEARP